jgi:hypothetical protein
MWEKKSSIFSCFTTVYTPLMSRLYLLLAPEVYQRRSCFPWIARAWSKHQPKDIFHPFFHSVKENRSPRLKMRDASFYLWHAPWRGPMDSITSGSTDIFRVKTKVTKLTSRVRVCPKTFHLRFGTSKALSFCCFSTQKQRSLTACRQSSIQTF